MASHLRRYARGWILAWLAVNTPGHLPATAVRTAWTAQGGTSKPPKQWIPKPTPTSKGEVDKVAPKPNVFTEAAASSAERGSHRGRGLRKNRTGNIGQNAGAAKTDRDAQGRNISQREEADGPETELGMIAKAAIANAHGGRSVAAAAASSRGQLLTSRRGQAYKYAIGTCETGFKKRDTSGGKAPRADSTDDEGAGEVLSMPPLTAGASRQSTASAAASAKSAGSKSSCASTAAASATDSFHLGCSTGPGARSPAAGSGIVSVVSTPANSAPATPSTVNSEPLGTPASTPSVASAWPSPQGASKTSWADLSEVDELAIDAGGPFLSPAARQHAGPELGLVAEDGDAAAETQMQPSETADLWRHGKKNIFKPPPRSRRSIIAGDGRGRGGGMSSSHGGEARPTGASEQEKLHSRDQSAFDRDRGRKRGLEGGPQHSMKDISFADFSSGGGPKSPFKASSCSCPFGELDSGQHGGQQKKLRDSRRDRTLANGKSAAELRADAENPPWRVAQAVENSTDAERTNVQVPEEDPVDGAQTSSPPTRLSPSSDPADDSIAQQAAAQAQQQHQPGTQAFSDCNIFGNTSADVTPLPPSSSLYEGEDFDAAITVDEARALVANRMVGMFTPMGDWVGWPWSVEGHKKLKDALHGKADHAVLSAETRQLLLRAYAETQKLLRSGNFLALKEEWRRKLVEEKGGEGKGMAVTLGDVPAEALCMCARELEWDPQKEHSGHQYTEQLKYLEPLHELMSTGRGARAVALSLFRRTFSFLSQEEAGIRPKSARTSPPHAGCVARDHNTSRRRSDPEQRSRRAAAKLIAGREHHLGGEVESIVPASPGGVVQQAKTPAMMRRGNAPFEAAETGSVHDLRAAGTEGAASGIESGTATTSGGGTSGSAAPDGDASAKIYPTTSSALASMSNGDVYVIQTPLSRQTTPEDDAGPLPVETMVGGAKKLNADGLPQNPGAERGEAAADEAASGTAAATAVLHQGPPSSCADVAGSRLVEEICQMSTELLVMLKQKSLMTKMGTYQMLEQMQQCYAAGELSAAEAWVVPEMLEMLQQPQLRQHPVPGTDDFLRELAGNALTAVASAGARLSPGNSTPGEHQKTLSPEHTPPQDAVQKLMKDFAQLQLEIRQSCSGGDGGGGGLLASSGSAAAGPSEGGSNRNYEQPVASEVLSQRSRGYPPSGQDITMQQGEGKATEEQALQELHNSVYQSLLQVQGQLHDVNAQLLNFRNTHITGCGGAQSESPDQQQKYLNRGDAAVLSAAAAPWPQGYDQSWQGGFGFHPAVAFPAEFVPGAGSIHNSGSGSWGAPFGPRDPSTTTSAANVDHGGSLPTQSPAEPEQEPMPSRGTMAAAAVPASMGFHGYQGEMMGPHAMGPADSSSWSLAYPLSSQLQQFPGAFFMPVPYQHEGQLQSFQPPGYSVDTGYGYSYADPNGVAQGMAAHQWVVGASGTDATNSAGTPAAPQLGGMSSTSALSAQQQHPPVDEGKSSGRRKKWITSIANRTYGDYHLIEQHRAGQRAREVAWTEAAGGSAEVHPPVEASALSSSSASGVSDEQPAQEPKPSGPLLKRTKARFSKKQKKALALLTSVEEKTRTDAAMAATAVSGPSDVCAGGAASCTKEVEAHDHHVVSTPRSHRRHHEMSANLFFSQDKDPNSLNRYFDEQAAARGF